MGVTGNQLKLLQYLCKPETLHPFVEALPRLEEPMVAAWAEEVGTSSAELPDA